MSRSAVSVIVPVYNRKDLVLKCLDSIKAQTYRPLTLIIVDNGSTDGTGENIRQWSASNSSPDFNVKIVYEPERGAAVARNRGVEASEDDYLIFMDSDDLMNPELVSYAMRAFEGHDIGHGKCRRHKPDLVCWRCRRHFLDGTAVKSRFSKRGVFKRHFYNAMLCTVNFAVRRDFFLSCGSWNASLTCWDDWENGIRMLFSEPEIDFIDKVLVNVYEREDSITGVDFCSKAGEWEKTLYTVENLIEKERSGKERIRLQGMVAYRMAVLAAHYRREGAVNDAEFLLEEALSRFPLSWWRRRLLRLIYSYTAMGGRGAYLIW